MLDGALNILRNRVGSGKQRSLRQMRGHGRGDKARANGQHLDTFAVQAVANTIQKGI